ncbi:hypothetical protein GCM10009777_04810 [Microbacterium pumilum]|uniref:Uncharacterized protein n=1 Tax=Microbacterium pumilum TaxID=344165 RepID=A0ABN2RU76_9MICO
MGKPVVRTILTPAASAALAVGTPFAAQARLLGPILLRIVGITHAVSALLQRVWSLTIGLIPRLAKVRETARFRAPARSAAPGLRDCISFAPPMELWAYGTEP